MSNESEGEATGWIAVVNSLLLTTALLAGMVLLSGSSNSGREEPGDFGVDRSELPSATVQTNPRLRKSAIRHESQDSQRLRKQLQDAMAERDLLRQQQADAKAAQDGTGVPNRSTEGNEALKAANRELENKLQDLRQTTRLALSMMSDRHEAILRPLSKAPVVVRIRSRKIRADLDLDLYVQDPLDRLCHWKVPRIENRQAEVATLIPSELLVGVEADAEAEEIKLFTEEVYYSTELLAGPASRPYLVFCMLRETGEHPTLTPIAQPVDWEIVINRKDQDPVRVSGQTIVSQSGRVIAQSTGDFYVGLVPLAGFHLQSAVQPEPIPLSSEELPEVLRGWRKGKSKEGATPLGKAADVKESSGR